MRDLILIIAKSLVDQRGEVEVTEVKGDITTFLELRVAKDDLGKVIGKQGKTAHAIRTILNAPATKLNQRAALEILE
ncbi:MAG: RNA-binding protein [Nitrospina sp.]|nr:RNA-binding protein [Nitrospina sp.]|tara:strand:- start:598 stop:828 length:231 start_codon:yes stop_codon:yes gene_type:complete